MSVKLMTVANIRNDLQAIAMAWPEGPPPEQVDRVNALLGELRRRGEDQKVAQEKPSATPRPPNPKLMTIESLQDELRALAARTAGGDETAQERFADVRFELRNRLKAAASAPSTPPPTRAIEFPDDDLGGPVEMSAKVQPTKRAQAPLSKMVRGFSARPHLTIAEVVVFEKKWSADGGTIVMFESLTLEEVDGMIDTLQEARNRAAIGT